MARRKTKRVRRVKISGVTRDARSPVQPGTIEVMNEGPLGPRYATIRSNAEAIKGLRGSKALASMISRITSDIPAPKEHHLIPADRLVESLGRVQEIQRRLINQAHAAAETAWPGFRDMFGKLVDREMEFTKALGELGVGVA